MAIVKKYPVKVTSILNQIEGVYTLELESLGKPFKFEPGQFLHLALDEYDPSAQWPDSRCFSIQSAPAQNTIKITYAVKGAFTSKMQEQLKVGSEITIKLPYGDLFSQAHNKINTVFIAGGTGITPYLSLFNDSSFVNYNKPVLYAGFKNAEMNIYKGELLIAKQINSALEINLLYQDIDGILNIEEIHNKSKNDTSFFISGPPIMISSFKEYLLRQGLTKEQIKTDDWE